MSANTATGTRKANAIGGGTKRRIRTKTIYHVSGNTPRGWKELRIDAPNKDAAIYRAHQKGMRVVECTELPSTRK